MGASLSSDRLPLRESNEELIARFGRSRVAEAETTSSHEIRPRLYLGSLPAALDPDEVHERRLTHVVNCLHPTAAYFKEALPAPGEGLRARQHAYVPPARLEYLSLDLADVPEEDLLRVLPETTAWIGRAVRASEAHNRVLVHCVAGVSRSATVVAAYIMATEGLSAARALREVQAKRNCANPNPGFRAQLIRWEERLASERARK
jgi:atypical dual specificity phosphatase